MQPNLKATAALTLLTLAPGLSVFFYRASTFANTSATHAASNSVYLIAPGKDGYVMVQPPNEEPIFFHLANGKESPLDLKCYRLKKIEDTLRLFVNGEPVDRVKNENIHFSLKKSQDTKADSINTAPSNHPPQL